MGPEDFKIEPIKAQQPSIQIILPDDSVTLNTLDARDLVGRIYSAIHQAEYKSGD